jgi:hypothetical protein
MLGTPEMFLHVHTMMMRMILQGKGNLTNEFIRLQVPAKQ